MATEIIIPAELWEGDEDTVISNWLISDGASVESGALIAEIMTSKVQYEIYAPASGTIRIKQNADAVVSKGTIIGVIE